MRKVRLQFMKSDLQLFEGYKGGSSFRRTPMAALAICSPLAWESMGDGESGRRHPGVGMLRGRLENGDRVGGAR